VFTEVAKKQAQPQCPQRADGRKKEWLKKKKSHEWNIIQP
jgi:hypothetical protein